MELAIQEGDNMGKFKGGRPGGIGISLSKKSKEFKKKQNITAVRMLAKSGGKAMKPQLLAGALAGMRDQLKKLKRNSEPLTVENMVREIRDEGAFLEAVAPAGITLADFEEMAKEVLNEEGVAVP